MKIRISSLPLIDVCPASAAETAVRVIDEQSEEAAWGTAFHAMMRDAMTAGINPDAEYSSLAAADKGFAELMDRGVAIAKRLRARYSDVEAEKPVELVVEAFGKQLEIRGTVDLVGYPTQEVREAEGIEAEIIDWKAMWGGKNYESQIKGYGYALARMKGLTTEKLSLQVAYVSFSTTKRILTTGNELGNWFEEFVRNKLMHPESYCPGSHCGLCSRAHDCRGKAALVRQVAMEFGGAGAITVTADLYDRIKAVESAVRDAMEILKAHVRENGPLMLPDGRVLNFIPAKKTTIVGHLALPVLRKELGEDAANALIEIGKTKTDEAIKDNARKYGAKIKDTLNQVYESLERAGAVIRSEEERFQPTKPKDVS